MARHWRGEYSLGRSFWLHGVIAWHLTFLVMIGLIVINPNDGSRTAKLVTLLSLLPLVILVWMFVGIWRSAGNAWRRGARFWPIVARLWLLALLVLEAYVAALKTNLPDF